MDQEDIVKEFLDSADSTPEFGNEPIASNSMALMFFNFILTVLSAICLMIITAIVGVLGMTYYKQDNLLYVPAVPNEAYRYPESLPAGYRNPREAGMQYEDVYITTKDKVKLHAWFIKANPTSTKLCRTLIFFHENAGNIGTRMPNIEILVKNL